MSLVLVLFFNDIRERSSITSSGFPKSWTPPPVSSRSSKALTHHPLLIRWRNTWMRVAGEKSNSALLLIAGWPDRSAKNQVTYTAHLRLSTAIKGAIILKFVLANRVTIKIHVMRSGWKITAAATLLCSVQNTNIPPAYVNLVCGRTCNNNTPDGIIRSIANKELLDRSTVIDS